MKHVFSVKSFFCFAVCLFTLCAARPAQAQSSALSLRVSSASGAFVDLSLTVQSFSPSYILQCYEEGGSPYEDARFYVQQVTVSGQSHYQFAPVATVTSKGVWRFYCTASGDSETPLTSNTVTVNVAE